MHDLTATQLANIDSARAISDTNRAAEDTTRARRLDRDRVIAGALCALEGAALRHALDVGPATFGCFLSGYCFVDALSHNDGGTAYFRELFAEIRASLSPLVR